MKTLGAIVIALVFVWYSVEAQRPNSQTGIEGVWRVVEQTINGRTLAGQNLGVGYHIYTKNYSAAVRESDVPPRPAFGGDSTATAAQILAAYGPFVAQFGSYKTVGDQLIGETLVAKNSRWSAWSSSHNAAHSWSVWLVGEHTGNQLANPRVEPTRVRL